MKNKISDQDVLNLLSNLRNAENNYPSDMIKSRRDSYIKQAAVMMALAGVGGNGATQTGTNQAAISNATGSSLAAGKLIEIALIVALVVEAGVAAYFYRDKIADFLTQRSLQRWKLLQAHLLVIHRMLWQAKKPLQKHRM